MTLQEQPPEGYNRAQWHAIHECDRHLLVAAGAGTGKTHTVVGKLLWLLGVPLDGRTYDRPLRLRDVAAITFTNQAAADLKRKLRGELRCRGQRRLAAEVDVARVGTIHGFCGDVLREFALRGDAPLGAQVLEEGESSALVAECARDVLLAACEAQEIAGLEELLGDYSVREVERWVAQLAGDADRLRRFTERFDEADARERALLRLADDALALLQQCLEERGAIDFDRMIVATRDLIRDDGGVRAALRRRIRVLIVDEFQDVDPVQREIAYLLGGVAEAGEGGTRLMLVGDPKQSIYRFRRADVTVWNQVQADFGAHAEGTVISLDENFRSVAPVLAFVEHWVGPALDEPVDGESGERQPFEVDFAPVRATRDDPPAYAGLEFLVVPPKVDGTACQLGAARAVEAANVADRMAALHRDHGVPWKSMAILLGGWGSLDVYRDALRRRAIPVYALRSNGLFDTREVVDLLLALQVARDPRDDRALAGLLRSPFVGLRDDTLLGMARSCRRPYWDRLDGWSPAEEAERVLLQWGRRLIERLVALRDRVSAGRLLRELLHDTGYLAHLSLLGEEGAQGVSNIRLFLADLDRRPDASVGELLREIEERRQRGDDVPQAPLYGESEDVVTITSVHSAKGLEWSVVFWCDLMRASRSDTSRLLVGRDRLCLGDPDAEPGAQREEWCALQRAMKLEGAAEQRRLWYVAATRARDLLVVSGIAPGKGARLGGTPAQQLIARYPLLNDGRPGTVPVSGQGLMLDVPVHLAEAELADVPAVEPPPLAAADSLALPAAPIAVPAGTGRHSATSLMLFARCQRRHWLRYVMGLREPEVHHAAQRGRAGEHDGGAVARGQVVHDVLEQLREDADLTLLLENAILEWDGAAPTRDTGAGARYRDRLMEELREVAADPNYHAVAALPSARHELGFLHIATDTAQVQGSMDLAACDDGGVVVLDVKTSRLESRSDAAAVAARYAVQRDVYTAAAAEVSGLPVTRFAFQFTRPVQQVDGGPTGDIHRLLRVLGVHEPQLAHDPADCERCGYRSVGWCAGAESPSASPAHTPEQ